MPSYRYANDDSLSALAEGIFDKIHPKDVMSDALNPTSLQTEFEQTAKNTHLTLEPIQDLHGYDHPWAGGAGKNLLPMTVAGIKAANTSGAWSGNVYTINGVSFTILTDDGDNVTGIKLNGTATKNTYFRVSQYNSAAGTFILNGCPSGGGNSGTYNMYDDDGNGFTDTGNGTRAVTLASGTRVSIYIQIFSGYTASNLIFYPMIRIASESDATFAPYSNICPISGLDEVEVKRTGEQYVDFSTAELRPISSLSSIKRVGFEPFLLQAGTYIVEGKSTSPDTIYVVNWQTGDNIVTFNNDYAEFTVSSATTVLVRTTYTTVNDFLSNYKDFKCYEKSTKHEVAVDLPTTIYGGTLDLETGELVCDRAMVKVSDLTWSRSYQFNQSMSLAHFIKHVATRSEKSSAITSCYITTPWKNNDDMSFSVYINGLLSVTDSRYSTVDGWLSNVANEQIVYELATPKTYTLTPKQLALLKGTNHISTNAKTVKVTFRAGQLATLEDVAGAVGIADEHLETALTPILGDFADIETSPAASNHAVGEYLLYNNRLYKVLAAISAGQQLTIGTNVGQTNVAAELASQASAISALNSKNLDNAGAHNAIYRGKYLGTSVTEAQWSAISSGAFTDLYIGDYWTINSVNWRIAAFDYWLNCGDTSCTTHHVVIVPDSNLHSAKMNDTNITTGAYLGSDFYTGNNGNTGRADAITKVNNAFGSSHILTHRELLTNATTNGYASGGTWVDATVELMNERMVYGNAVFENMISGTNIPHDYTIDKSQLPLFAHEPSRICNRGGWWLCSVASSAYFSFVFSRGFAAYGVASYSGGVRPAFGIK